MSCNCPPLSWRSTAAAALLAATASFLLSLPVAAQAPADLAAGEQAYAKCMGCHSPEHNRTGPLHCGLLGRESGSVKDYDYSPAMRSARIIWTSQTLDQFLAAPLRNVPGTSMGFAGIPDSQERRNLIAWLATLNDSSDRCRSVLSKPRENS